MDQRPGGAARHAVQAVREQFLADAGLAQQQHRQLRIGDHVELLEQAEQRPALPDDFRLAGRPVGRRAARLGAPAGAQGAVLLLDPGHAHRSLDQQRQLGQRVAGRRVKHLAAAFIAVRRVERQHAPRLAVEVQADAHAVVYRQRFVAMIFEQAVVRIGQRTAGREAHRRAAGEDRRQARMLRHHETPAERFPDQPVDGQRPQPVALDLEQADGAAAEVRADGVDQALQAHRMRQFGHQVGEQQRSDHGK
ncbi:MAG: hypothetical protein QM701_18120 [Propionivibrio sp.]